MSSTGSFGADPHKISIGTPALTYEPMFPAALSTHSDALGTGSFEALLTAGPPADDAANGYGVKETRGYSTAELIFFGEGDEGTTFRCFIYGARPFAPKSMPSDPDVRAAVYATALFVRRPLLEVFVVLGGKTGLASSLAVADWGIDADVRFGATITIVRDYTISQNARALGSGVDDIAAAFFDCSGFTHLVCHGSTNDDEASSTSSASDATPGADSFGVAIAYH